MSDPTSGAALHALLGVPADIGSTDLRLAYDRAMAMAVRMGDNRRALALSQAFDALPGGVRQQVYPAVQHRRAAVDLAPRRPARRGRATRGTAGGRTGPGGSIGRPARRGGRLARVRRRTIVIVVLVALAVPAGITVALHWHQWLKRPGDDSDGVPRQSGTTIVQQAPVPVGSSAPVQPSIPDAQTEGPGPNARRIPTTTPVDANGFVTIECPARAGRAGYLSFARPGDVVTCRNGAVPRILDTPS